MASMNESELGVIIQGPLITYGQGPNNSSDGFGVADFVIRNYIAAKRSGFICIYSTWPPKTIPEKEILENIERANVPVMLVNAPKRFDPDHRIKHHFGIQAGLSFFQKNQKNPNYLLKIRADMLMPDQFWVCINRLIADKSEMFYVSHLMEKHYYLGDFIYFSNSDTFRRFINFVTHNEGNIHPCISTDAGIKFCLSMERPKRFRKNSFLLDSILQRKEYCDLWNSILLNKVAAIPESIWQKIVWRNKHIGQIIDSKEFKFFSSPIKCKKTSKLKRFIDLLNDFNIYWRKAAKQFLNDAKLNIFLS